ncbi:MAG: hypothetical protein BHV87_07885 [Clostridiales bacterium 36_14]|nr:MAG: hypothetical protein BHV87_07885 [Clostridiales bacterium 36_14]
MSDFTVIETQEQFEQAVEERLNAEREKYSGYLSPDDVAEKYKDYLSPDEVEKKYTGYISAQEAAEKDTKIKQYEQQTVRTKVAKELGLSCEAADFIKGDNEEEMKKSAEALKGILGKNQAPPLRSNETGQGSDKDEALRNTLRKLKGE